VDISYTKQDTIFVQIASYRDPELQHTLQDLFKKAKRPENIFVGICHQYDMKGDEDKHLFEVPFPRSNQLRIDKVDYRESEGCCWARNRVQKLWKGEKWILMIDSHMRFEKGWDETCVTLIKELKKRDRNAVISNINPSYFYDGGVEKKIITTTLWFDANGIIPFGGPSYSDVGKHNEPFLSCMYSGGFLFCEFEVCRKIPYDKFMYFYGEEISTAVRLWTNGYNIYNANKNITYHLYKENIKNLELYKNLGEGFIPSSNLHKSQSQEKSVKKDKITFARVKHLLGSKKSRHNEVLESIKDYGLGSKRTLRDYERFSGIDFRKKKMREHTKRGIFEILQPISKLSEVKEYFNEKSLLCHVSFS